MPHGEPRSPQSGPGERAGKSGRRGQRSWDQGGPWFGRAVESTSRAGLSSVVLKHNASMRRRLRAPSGPGPPSQNLRGRLRPDEGPGVRRSRRLLQTRFEVQDAAADPLLRQRAEEALDQVQPRGAGRDEVEVHALRALGPLPNLAVLVGRVVVQDDVDLPPLRHSFSTMRRNRRSSWCRCRR